MSLSIFTNPSSMSASAALTRSNSSLNTAMARLGTGKRINSASDDAAGLQIATRLQGQSNGMTMAKRNIADATAVLQTAEGAFNEITEILYRMKDLATQSANDTNADSDRAALQSEFMQLNSELTNILNNTSYNSQKLLNPADASGAGAGKLATQMNFQIGASPAEVMQADFVSELTAVQTAVTALTASGNSIGVSGASGHVAANAMIGLVTTALDSVGGIRASLGANINRLAHTSSNLTNIQDNTNIGLGNIRDADFAVETTTMTRNQMLVQTGMNMLKQSNNMSGMVMSLLS